MIKQLFCRHKFKVYDVGFDYNKSIINPEKYFKFECKKCKKVKSLYYSEIKYDIHKAEGMFYFEGLLGLGFVGINKEVNVLYKTYKGRVAEILYKKYKNYEF